MRRGDRVSLASDPMTGALVVKILGHDTVRVFWRRHSTHAGRCTVELESAFEEPGAHLARSGRASLLHIPVPVLRATDAPMYPMHGRDLWAAHGWKPFRIEDAPSCGHPKTTATHSLGQPVGSSGQHGFSLGQPVARLCSSPGLRG